LYNVDGEQKGAADENQHAPGSILAGPSSCVYAAAAGRVEVYICGPVKCVRIKVLCSPRRGLHAGCRIERALSTDAHHREQPYISCAHAGLPDSAGPWHAVSSTEKNIDENEKA